MSVNDFLLDFAIASLFIMIGQLIRAKVKVVQKFFVPASMIAGFIALALGSQGLYPAVFRGHRLLCRSVDYCDFCGSGNQRIFLFKE